jgi:squalene synthase HpnC
MHNLPQVIHARDTSPLTEGGASTTLPPPSASVPLPRSAEVMARARSENFTVASLMLPRGVRAHLLAIYGFARLVDDIGDELPAGRLAALDRIEAELESVYAAGTPTHPLMLALVPTVRACGLPAEPFRALIAANRQDQSVHSYETIDELLAYCRLSANPVGHLVLQVLGAASTERLRLSDSVCSGLQLAEHWQDVGEDLSRGRIYIPLADLRRFGCTPADLERRPIEPRVRRLIAFEVERAHRLLDAGVPLVRSLRGRPAVGVAAFVAGGRAALRAIRRAHHDVLEGTPRPTGADRAWALAATLAQSRRR